MINIHSERQYQIKPHPVPSSRYCKKRSRAQPTSMSLKNKEVKSIKLNEDCCSNVAEQELSVLSNSQKYSQVQYSDASLNSSNESFLLNQLSEAGCEGLLDLFLGSGYDFSASENLNQQVMTSSTQDTALGHCPSQDEALGNDVSYSSNLTMKDFNFQGNFYRSNSAEFGQYNNGFDPLRSQSYLQSDSDDDYEDSAPIKAEERSILPEHADSKSTVNRTKMAVLKRKESASSEQDSNSGRADSSTRKMPMSLDEKAEASRDRNRKHARNTRLRKKAYIEDLERTVRVLTTERDVTNATRSSEVARTAHLQSIRFSLLQMVLYYRASGNLTRIDWSTVLEETFTCVLPITPYRSFPSSEVVGGQRMIVGIDAMIADVASLMIMVESISRRRPSEGRVQIQYYAGPEDAISSGDMLSCRWMLRTENAVACGALFECHCQGMLRVRFSPAHKLSHLEIIFDVMGFMQQLQRASGLDEFRVVPNTLQMAQQPTEDARFITTAEPPYIIVHVSSALCTLCGYLAEEILGRTPAMWQGPGTIRPVIVRFMSSIRRKNCCSMEVINYTKAGIPFSSHVTSYPLTTDGRVTHFLATVNLDAALKSMSTVTPLTEAFSTSCVLPQTVVHPSVLTTNTAPLVLPGGIPLKNTTSSAEFVRQTSTESLPIKAPNSLQRQW